MDRDRARKRLTGCYVTIPTMFRDSDLSLDLPAIRKHVHFLIEGGKIRKIADGKLIDAAKEEFEKKLAENKGKLNTTVSGEVFMTLEKVLGKFEILL